MHELLQQIYHTRRKESFHGPYEGFPVDLSCNHSIYGLTLMILSSWTLHFTAQKWTTAMSHFIHLMHVLNHYLQIMVRRAKWNLQNGILDPVEQEIRSFLHYACHIFALYNVGYMTHTCDTCKIHSPYGPIYLWDFLPARSSYTLSCWCTKAVASSSSSVSSLSVGTSRFISWFLPIRKLDSSSFDL